MIYTITERISDFMVVQQTDTDALDKKVKPKKKKKKRTVKRIVSKHLNGKIGEEKLSQKRRAK